MKAIDILFGKLPKLADLVQQAINEETEHLKQQLADTQVERDGLGKQLFDLQTELMLKGVL